MATVYKYLSPDLKECYVGSTAYERVRKNMHKRPSKFCSSKLLFDKYGYENCSYIVLEVCPLEEQFIREQWWLDHAVGAVNINKVSLKEITVPINRMTLIVKDTQSNEEQTMEDGVTIEHIIYALNWIKKEKARQAGKYQRYVKPKREAMRDASPTPEPVPEAPAKRPRGRPRKYPIPPAI